MRKWAFGIVVLVIVVAGLIYGSYEKMDYDFDDTTKTYEIVNKWNLPNALDEISGIAWISNDRLACIEDEHGIIYIYDLKKSQIISRQKFGGSGDYEAITTMDSAYWVAESDGKLYKIPMNKMISPENTTTYKTGFEYKNNIEGITATSDGKLLISVKDHNLKPKNEEQDEKSKAVYTYDPVSQKLNEKASFRININDTIFKKVHTHEEDRKWRPTDMQFHPITGELYMIDSEIPKVLVLNKEGRIIKMHLLDPAEFFQPEGICFSPSGRIFISNEGKGGDPSIVEVKFQ
ncbi:hypothetical protein C7S20_14180 [Christiangramia fulva]|uniref:SdiA-regulated family protein n=1 Tax=Christiangramia fulva TaxID=2126553 RepID=A0A2R3Z7W6_9FLAO|nr:SdiA-regulated domain-containing protein [Christiangramia fulva]AVR46318.1 hypothetical protein C7S20_14180 [Christiangramia fulva]